ncbi:MAG TPA: M23 family metallopeptidase, partial [Gemmatimonadaceae bacterium]|nr:M23 family metallopeptidase [Gemmatimonadaceae bacterium]
PLPAPPEPPRLASDGRARRADSARQPHDKWTFVVIPPGTGARPRTLHISVRRLRAMFAAAGAVTAVSVLVTAVLGLVLSGAPRLESEWKGVQLGVLAAAPSSSIVGPALPAALTPPPAALPVPEGPPAAPAAAAPVPRTVPRPTTPAVAATPRAVRAPIAVAPAPRRVAPTLLHEAPTVEEAGVGSSGIIGSLPVIGRITSNFSRARRHPLLGVVRRHKGVDIAAPSGTRITAPLPGRVRFAGRKVGFGLMVEIDHGSGVVTRYAHCRSLDVAAGRRVEAGETIARVGRTGLATGTHLHYEILVNGRSVDPLRTSLSALLPRGASDGGVALPTRIEPLADPLAVPAPTMPVPTGPAPTGPDSASRDTTSTSR